MNILLILSLAASLASCSLAPALAAPIKLLSDPPAAQTAASSPAALRVPSSPAAVKALLADKIIVIDPGHGGNDSGAVANGVREAAVNLSVSLKVRDKLTAAGANVIMTRITDVSLAPGDSPDATELKARVDIAKAADADIFVSIHSNYSPKSEIAGAISFYQSGRPSDLPQAIQRELGTAVGAPPQDVRPNNFHVMRENFINATLIELGFLSNAAEAKKLTEEAYQEKLASAIASGIIRYFADRTLNANL